MGDFSRTEKRYALDGVQNVRKRRKTEKEQSNKESLNAHFFKEMDLRESVVCFLSLDGLLAEGKTGFSPGFFRKLWRLGNWWGFR